MPFTAPQFLCASVNLAMTMPMLHTQAGHLPWDASSTSLLPPGARIQRGEKQGNLGISSVWSFCLGSLLLPPNLRTKPGRGTHTWSRDGSHCGAQKHGGIWGQNEGSPPLHWQTVSMAWPNMLDTSATLIVWV